MSRDPNLHPIRSEILAAARAQIGVREVKQNWSDRIAQYLASVGLYTPQPWCAAAVRYILDQTRARHVGPRSGAVRRWRDWAVRQGDRAIGPSEVVPGDLGWWLNADGTGHIFVIESVAGLPRLPQVIFTTLEGNTNAAGSREGNAFLRKQRSLRFLASRHAHGFIRTVRE